MESFRKIAVGLDLDAAGKSVSVGSRKAALQARVLAEKTGASVTFCHSTFRERITSGDPSRGEEPSPEVLALLETFAAEEASSGVSTSLVFTQDPAWLGLTRLAVRGEADLIIVGKRSEFARDGRKLGTVAVNLLRNCPVPVWVAHPEYGLIYDTVLAATDLTEVGDLATELASRLARFFGAELYVVHAYQIPMSLQLDTSDEERAEKLAAIEGEARRHIEAVLGADASGASIHVGCTSPSRAILEAVDRLAPDLLVMGTLSRSGIAGLLVGNTAERLLDRVDCSLLTLKPADFVSPIGPE